MTLLGRFARWLHTGWPAGIVERLPEARPDGSTNVPGLFVAGDIRGVPLLKFAADSGARVVQTIIADPSFRERESSADALDLVIIGAGVAGMAAALEARRAGLRFEVLEATEPFSTIVNFPRAKPIFTYPSGMAPAGALQFKRSNVKEGLLDELRDAIGEIRATAARAEKVARQGRLLVVHVHDQPSRLTHRVLVAVGRSGNFRKLGVPGEDLDHVSNRLHDPRDFAGKRVLVVGGGDSAVEASVALALSGAHVTLSYRKAELARPKQENIEKLRALARDPQADVAVERPTSERVTTSAGAWMGRDGPAGSLRLMLGSRVREIGALEVAIDNDRSTAVALPAEAVFVMIGRDAPLEVFRKSRVKIAGEHGWRGWAALLAFGVFCTWLYHWKGEKPLPIFGRLPAWLDPDPSRLWHAIAAASAWLAPSLADPMTLLGTLRLSASGRSFWYTLAYTLIVVVFGIRRIRRRQTPYVTAQTLTLMTFQVVPLFVLPEIILPLLGHNGWFDHGPLRAIADALFPVVSYGHGREYWRAYGFILAWPLFVYNAFSAQPLWAWLALSALQTFVIIPLLVLRFGKGAYCGWVCSCGALAETLGDTHRHKMPHGPASNRVNLVGQGVLTFAFVLLALRIASWIRPSSLAHALFESLFHGAPLINYTWFVDLFLAGVVGYGAYFWYSGRVWCRFACPLAALMHLYARFSSFRILAEKKRCISCNVCTSVCHQGIDVMSFANKGLAMEDPECVRCSACVQSCPTGVLAFGAVDRRSGAVVRIDRLEASPVRLREARPTAGGR